MVERFADFALLGCGLALGGGAVGNEALAGALDMAPEEIERRCGVRSRRVALEGESASVLGARAAREALDNAGLGAGDLGLLLLSTYTPDHLLCPSAPALAEELGARGIPAFDLNAACAGGVVGMLVALSMMDSGLANHALVVSSDQTSLFLARSSKTRMIFGDGAAALALGRPSEGGRPWRVRAASLGADGSGAAMFRIPEGGSACPPVDDAISRGSRAVEMHGRPVFRFAVDRGARLLDELAEKAAVSRDDVDHVVVHQANDRIVEALIDRSRLPAERFARSIAETGNLASASVPYALAERLREGLVAPGELVMLVAFGAGLSWAGALLEAGEVPRFL